MHSLSPPVAHCNLKAANILLDDKLKPRVCDSGLSVLRPLSSNSVKVKVNATFACICTSNPYTHAKEVDVDITSYKSVHHNGSSNNLSPACVLYNIIIQQLAYLFYYCDNRLLRWLLLTVATLRKTMGKQEQRT